MTSQTMFPLGIRRCFDVDIRLKQHRDVDNEISTLQCFNVVLKALHQRYRIDVVSTWNQGLFFDVNWQPKFNVVSILSLRRCINVVELTLFQHGIRVDFSSTSFNDVVTTSYNRRQNDLHFQHFYNVVSTDV